MESWHSYPSIYNLGHRYIQDLLTVSVNVEEKIDGSQFSFGVDEQGELHIRSKGATLYVDAPETMFSKAVTAVKELQPLLHPGWTYRAEYLSKNKHNALNYGRIPTKNIIVFDINTSEVGYLSYEEKKQECQRLGLEVVPLLFSGKLTMDKFQELMSTDSVLGQVKIEGVVVKPTNYDLYGQDKKVLMGKFVSEAFKEVHKKEWKEANPTKTDVILFLAEKYRTEARWQKAVIHLAERGELTESPKDIGKLMVEVPADILKECEEEIKQFLFNHFWSEIRRRVIHGLPEWYKEELAKKQFESEEVGVY